MIGGITVKVCGITSAEDAALAVKAGADYLGFILYPKSPRYIATDKFKSVREKMRSAGTDRREPASAKPMAGEPVPPPGLVAVMVEPSAAELNDAESAGFDCFQVHFSEGTRPEAIASWVRIVGRERLWLAPRLPPGSSVGPGLLDLASTFLIDTFHRDKFGGTGEPGDWQRFADLQRENPRKTWILSGGLTPLNIEPALEASGARFIDLNSGVEEAPGRKDPAKLEAFAAAVRRSYH